MSKSRLSRRIVLAAAAVFLVALHPLPAGAQPLDATPRDTLRLSIDDAVTIALARARELQRSTLDRAAASADLDGARAALLPRVATDAGFTRDIQPVDPFAGTRAAEFIGQDVPTEWLAFNERARTDGDPTTQPIPLDEFVQRQEQAFREAGVVDPDAAPSPFTVPNQFQAGVSFSQPVYAPAAAAEVRAARAQLGAAEAGVSRQRAVTADSARQAFLGALLSRQQVGVLQRSVARTQATLTEAERRIDEGIAPVSERLSSAVELANLQTDLVQAERADERARSNLKLTLGLSPLQPVELDGALTVEDVTLAGFPIEDAVALALASRADVAEARLQVRAQQAQVDAARASMLPSVNAVLNVNVSGNIPDDRDRVLTDPLNPFDVQVQGRGIFASDFWSLGASAGLQVQWNLFEGGRLRAQSERAQIGVQQAALLVQELEDFVRFEVEDALQELRAARDRLIIQQGNVGLAEENYRVADARVRQGVATTLERRDASTQLDRSRLNLLQAIHDYRSARSRFLAALGAETEMDWP